jgi:cation transport regulator
MIAGENCNDLSQPRRITESVKDHLPKHAQEIYKEAYKNAWDQYSDPSRRCGNESREEVSNKVAWSAVE